MTESDLAYDSGRLVAVPKENFQAYFEAIAKRDRYERERDELKAGIGQAHNIITAFLNGEGCMDQAFTWMANFTFTPSDPKEPKSPIRRIG